MKRSRPPSSGGRKKSGSAKGQGGQHWPGHAAAATDSEFRGLPPPPLGYEYVVKDEQAPAQCLICKKGGDEDTVLLCDGPGCGLECHMYCLRPPLLAVPDGDWLCPYCEPNGTTAQLSAYIKMHDSLKAAENLQTPNEYTAWLVQLQERYIPFARWRPNIIKKPILAEFHEKVTATTHTQLIGSPLRLFLEDPVTTAALMSQPQPVAVVQQQSTGRIIATRYNTQHDTVEIFVQFRSGIEGRNKEFLCWLSPAEHACTIGNKVCWAKIQGFSFWPGQHYQQSGVELLNRIKWVDGGLDAAVLLQNMTSVETAKLGSMLVFFFGDESLSVLPKGEVKNSVLPFDWKTSAREVRNGSRRIATAFCIAAIEVEERESAVRAVQRLSESRLTATGSLFDGLTMLQCKAVFEGLRFPLPSSHYSREELSEMAPSDYPSVFDGVYSVNEACLGPARTAVAKCRDFKRLKLARDEPTGPSSPAAQPSNPAAYNPLDDAVRYLSKNISDRTAVVLDWLYLQDEVGAVASPVPVDSNTDNKQTSAAAKSDALVGVAPLIGKERIKSVCTSDPPTLIPFGGGTFKKKKSTPDLLASHARSVREAAAVLEIPIIEAREYSFSATLKAYWTRDKDKAVGAVLQEQRESKRQRRLAGREDDGDYEEDEDEEDDEVEGSDEENGEEDGRDDEEGEDEGGAGKRAAIAHSSSSATATAASASASASGLFDDPSQRSRRARKPALKFNAASMKGQTYQLSGSEDEDETRGDEDERPAPSRKRGARDATLFGDGGSGGGGSKAGKKKGRGEPAAAGSALGDEVMLDAVTEDDFVTKARMVVADDDGIDAQEWGVGVPTLGRSILLSDLASSCWVGQLVRAKGGNAGPASSPVGRVFKFQRGANLVYYRTAQGVILTGRLHSLLVVPEQSQEGQVFLDEEVLFGVDWINGGAEAEAEAEAAHASSSYAPVSIPRGGRQEAAPPRGLIQKRARVKGSGKGGASKDSDSDSVADEDYRDHRNRGGVPRGGTGPRPQAKSSRGGAASAPNPLSLASKVQPIALSSYNKDKNRDADRPAQAVGRAPPPRPAFPRPGQVRPHPPPSSTSSVSASANAPAPVPAAPSSAKYITIVVDGVTMTVQDSRGDEALGDEPGAADDADDFQPLEANAPAPSSNQTQAQAQAQSQALAQSQAAQFYHNQQHRQQHLLHQQQQQHQQHQQQQHQQLLLMQQQQFYGAPRVMMAMPMPPMAMQQPMGVQQHLPPGGMAYGPRGVPLQYAHPDAAAAWAQQQQQQQQQQMGRRW